MRASTPKPSRVATIVDGEHAQELFRPSRCLPLRRSTMLSRVMSFASELIVGRVFAFGDYCEGDVELPSRPVAASANPIVALSHVRLGGRVFFQRGMVEKNSVAMLERIRKRGLQGVPMHG